GEDVGDDPHGGSGRINIGVPHHKLFEDVVLNSSGKLGRRKALLLARHDEEREYGKHRAVHGHRYTHLRKRDSIEQRAHVEERIEDTARHADIALDAWMVAVVAGVGGKVKGDGEALLPRRKVTPVKGVRILGGGKTCILPDRPGLLNIHRWVRAA